jgi:hypothetical protein
MVLVATYDSWVIWLNPDNHTTYTEIHFPFMHKMNRHLLNTRSLVLTGFFILLFLASTLVTAYYSENEPIVVNRTEGILSSSWVNHGSDAEQPVNTMHQQPDIITTTQITQYDIPADKIGKYGNAPVKPTSEILSSAPAPYFPTGSYSIHTSYALSGLIVSSKVGKVVTNGGGAGNLFYNISGSLSSPKTKTIQIASGESVKVWAEFCSFTYYCPFQFYQMSVRISRPGDKDVGNFVIEPTPTHQIGVFRPSNHRFYLKNGTANTTINWGLTTDLPVTGDWNNDGFTDVGVFRPANYKFYLRNGSATISPIWGLSTDLPVTGHWNSDGRSEVGVFRQSNHRFYLRNGTANTSVNWGMSGDRPVSGRWS